MISGVTKMRRDLVAIPMLLVKITQFVQIPVFCDLVGNPEKRLLPDVRSDQSCFVIRRCVCVSQREREESTNPNPKP